MATEIVMPALGLTMTEGTIQVWLKRVGDSVRRDEPLFVVETDKAATEVVSPADGVLLEILAVEGATVPVQQVIAYLMAPGESVVPAAPAPPVLSTVAPPGQGQKAKRANGETPVPPLPRFPVSPTLDPDASSPRLPLGRPEREAGGLGSGAPGDQVTRAAPARAAPVGGSERERLLWMYRTMLRIRSFDERIVLLFAAGKIAGALHSYVGEEAVATGLGAHLRPDDFIVSTHRGHGHLLAKGGQMNRMMAELYGRVDGYCRGKGGSMHITDVSLGILGANGIVGAGITIATGAGTAIQLQGGDQVVACFFGDGAANIGPFHEGINLAATWNLPVIFVCENNLYAQFTPQRLHAKTPDLFGRAPGYGIPGMVVDGNDVLAVAEVTGEAIARARRGEGPSLIEAKTFRWYGHAINNPASNLGRDPAEIERWKRSDPIRRLEQQVLGSGIARQSELEAIRDAVVHELEEAIAFAEASPSPTPEEALQHVYAELPPGAEL
ncbi:MAG: hypothetical protein HYY04_16375 [Chloroflexi bacterium]|nr:hypothetical protein [Chloroflexota bacterium]